MKIITVKDLMNTYSIRNSKTEEERKRVYDWMSNVLNVFNCVQYVHTMNAYREVWKAISLSARVRNNIFHGENYMISSREYRLIVKKFYKFLKTMSDNILIKGE